MNLCSGWCMCTFFNVSINRFCSWCRMTDISLCRAGIVSHTSTTPHMAHCAHWAQYSLFPSSRYHKSTLSLRHPCRLCNANWMSDRHGSLDKSVQTVSTALWSRPAAGTEQISHNSVAVEAVEWKIRPPSVRAALHVEQGRTAKKHSGRERSESGGRNCVWKWG